MKCTCLSSLQWGVRTGWDCVHQKKVNPDGLGFGRKRTEQKLVRSFLVDQKKKRRKEIKRTTCLTGFYTYF